jgi:hypothetical protein
MIKRMTALALRRGLRQITGTEEILIEGTVVSSNTSHTSFRILFYVWETKRTLKTHNFHYNPELRVYWTNIDCELMKSVVGREFVKSTSVTLYWRASNNLEPCHI